MGQVEFYIRPALFNEWCLCLALLPDLISSRIIPEIIFAAFDKSAPDKILGVGAAVPVIKDVEKPGFSVIVHVLNDYRRQGVGSQLVRKLSSYVASWDVPYIHGWQSYTVSDQSHFLQACGFEPYLNYYGFEVPRSSAIEILAILEKYSRRSLDSEAFEFRPINTSLQSEEVKLYSQHFLVTYDVALQRMQQASLRNASSLLSSSLFFGGKLHGFITGYEDVEGVPKVDFWVTQRLLTHTPAAMLLLCHFVKKAYDSGYSRARFDCNDQARSTLRVAKRLNASQIFHSQSFALPTHGIK